MEFLVAEALIDCAYNLKPKKNSAGFESYIGVMLKQVAGGTLAWEAQQCEFFHLCLAFKVGSMNFSNLIRDRWTRVGLTESLEHWCKWSL